MSFDFGSQDQRPAFEADKAACEQRIGTPPPPEPLTDAQVRAQYQHLVEMRTCLLRLGYPTSNPPPEDAFVETWRAAELRPGEDGRVVEDAPWSPFLDVPGPALEEVADQCPQVSDGGSWPALPAEGR